MKRCFSTIVFHISTGCFLLIDWRGHLSSLEHMSEQFQSSDPRVGPGISDSGNGHAGHTAIISLPAPRPEPDPSDHVAGSTPGPEPGPLPLPTAMSVVSSGIALAAAEAGVSHLSDYHLLGDLGRTAGIQGAWYAHRLKLIAELYHRPIMLSATREPGSRRKALSAADLTVAEIAPQLHLGEDAARRLLSRALTLTSRLPATLALLADGQLDEDRANAMEDLVGKMAAWAYESVLEDDGSPRLAEHAATALAGMVESRVLKRAPSQRTDLLRNSTRTAIARIAPAYAATLNRHATAGRNVFVTHRKQDEQMGFLGAHLSIVEAKACFAALDTRARALRHLGDLRTLDQLRADALVEAILNPSPIAQATTATRARTGSATSRDVARGVSAHVQVTVSLETLIGLRDDPGHLTGYGALTAEVARAVAFTPGSTWRRLITDPLSGTLLDYGRTRYKAPGALADHVIARDVTCSHPGCTRPAENCDLDHLLPFPLGATCECNLRPRCRRHHRLKHETPWKVTTSSDPDDPDGTLISTSPTGHTYRTHRPTFTEPTAAEPKPPATQPSPSTPPGPAGLQASDRSGADSE